MDREYYGLSANTSVWLANNATLPDNSTYTELDGAQRKYFILSGEWYEIEPEQTLVKITDGTDTADVIAVNGHNGLVTITPGHISTDNSTTDLLGIGGVFTGTAEDTTNYGNITLSVYASHVSATDGLEIQFSYDGTNWFTTDQYTIPATTCKTFSIQCVCQYFRVKYTNGGTLQTQFFLSTTLRNAATKPSSHRIADTISDQDDAELTKAVLTAENPSNEFINVGASESGNLKVTDAENGLAISKGEVTGSTFVHKFGNAPDFDYGDGEVTIWDGADDGSINQMTYTFSTTAAIDTISSDNAGDTQDVRLQGLDENWELVTQEVTLDGQNKVTLDTPLIRVFRGRNLGSTDFAGRIFVYEDTTITAGVPNDLTKVRLLINDGINQTLMAIYTVPAGYTGYLRDWYASTAGASKSSQYVIKLKGRCYDGVFQTKHITSISDTGTSYIQHKYEEPEKFEEKTDIIMTAQATATGATGCSISAGFDIVLVEN